MTNRTLTIIEFLVERSRTNIELGALLNCGLPELAGRINTLRDLGLIYARREARPGQRGAPRILWTLHGGPDDPQGSYLDQLAQRLDQTERLDTVDDTKQGPTGFDSL